MTTIDDTAAEPTRVARTAVRSPLLHEELTKAVIGAFYRAYNGLGYGFLESVYVNALMMELTALGLHVECERRVEVRYKGEVVGEYRCDLIVEGKIVVEVKANERLGDSAERQLYNYLRCGDLEVGLLLHFGLRPKFRRLVCAREN
jgi:GxxExxY protein